MSTVAEELKRLSELASFTMSDMAEWCECGKSVMRNWLLADHVPHPIKEKYLRKRLDLLVLALKDLPDKLPVPDDIKMHQRISYVKQVREHALKKLSRKGVAGWGV